MLVYLETSWISLTISHGPKVLTSYPSTSRVTFRSLVQGSHVQCSNFDRIRGMTLWEGPRNNKKRLLGTTSSYENRWKPMGQAKGRLTLGAKFETL